MNQENDNLKRRVEEHETKIEKMIQDSGIIDKENQDFKDELNKLNETVNSATDDLYEAIKKIKILEAESVKESLKRAFCI